MAGADRKTRDAAEIYLTAAEAYPALEALFLEARSEISAGFRVFDIRTRLRGRGREVGRTWADLIGHTLARGVSFRLILADFDPVVRPSMHRETWRATASLMAAGEASGRPDLLSVIPAMHPARVGLGMRLAFWPKIAAKLRDEARRLNGLEAREAEDQLAHMPGLKPHLAGEHPHLRPRIWPVAPLIPASHHQKLAVFDRERLFIGGIDLNERRYDTPDHDRPGRDTWHDTQLLIEGPAAREAQAHLDTLLSVANARQEPPEMRHLLRTISTRHRYTGRFRLSPKTIEKGLEDAHIARARKARRLIYLETQFFRSLPVARALARAARDTPDLRLLLVLPGAPEDVAYDNAKEGDARYGEYLQAKCVHIVSKAFGDRAFVMAPGQPKHAGHKGRASLEEAPLVYLHAKVAIFDHDAAIVSSANLNGRSLRWDTEAGVTLTEADTVQHLRHRCFAHWLPEDAEDAYFTDETAIAAWAALADRNEERDPDDREGFVMRYPVAPARRFGRNLPGLPEELV
jgi:phospholipase D1/2